MVPFLVSYVNVLLGVNHYRVVSASFLAVPVNFDLQSDFIASLVLIVISVIVKREVIREREELVLDRFHLLTVLVDLEIVKRHKHWNLVVEAIIDSWNCV